MLPELSDAKQIFLDALEQPSGDRRAFVDRVCAGDALLSARVRALLESNDAGDGILDHSLPIDLSTIGASVVPPTPGQIGEYQLVRVLGRGGFGVVWLAEQVEPLKRSVALKLLHPSLTGFGALPVAAAEVIARFEAERQALAGMDHPNIARAIDAGTIGDGPHAGQPYFVMEFIDGPPITHYCNELNLGLQPRLELFIKVCAGVQHAHQKGLIHRDLKPGNVLVATVDGAAMPKVIDFGVAKAIGETAAATLTQQSQVIGTPQYMSPEQAQSGMARVDTRSDVYSLGAVLYELLVGVPPLDAKSLRGSSLQQICKVVCEQVPIRPSLQAGAARPNADRIAARLRGELDWIIMKALEKEPQRRYQSATDLAGDIERHLKHQPVSAGPPSRIYLARKFVRRHRAGVLMSVVLALGLATATIVSLLQASRARRAERAAVAQARQTQQELAKYTSLAKFSQGILTSIDPAVARGRDRSLLQDVLVSASKRADADLADQPEVAQSIHTTLGFAHAAIGDSTAAYSHYQKALTICEKLFGPEYPESLHLKVSSFAMLVEMGRLDEAEQLGNRLPEAYARSGLGDSAEALSMDANLGALYIRQKRPADALPLLERAAAGRIKLHGEGTPRTFGALNNLGYVYKELGQFDRAKATWEQLLVSLRKQHGEDHPQTLTTVNNLAMVAESMGDFATAETLLKQSLAGKQRIHQPGHPSRVVTELNVGTFYFEQGRFAEAAEILEAAYRDCVDHMPVDDERRLVVTLRLAEVRRRSGRAADARPLAIKAYERFSMNKEDSRGIAALVLQMAIAADLKEVDQSSSLLDQCKPCFDKSAEFPRNLQASLAFHAARASMVIGKAEAAQAHLATARAAAAELPKSDSLRQEIEAFAFK